jgi:hypothetical protein
MIDYGKAPTPALSTDFILWLHREFCERLPNDLLWVENPDTGERLRAVPGELRQRHVRVGRHIPPDPQELSAFLARFVGLSLPNLLPLNQRVQGSSVNEARPSKRKYSIRGRKFRKLAAHYVRRFSVPLRVVYPEHF